MSAVVKLGRMVGIEIYDKFSMSHDNLGVGYLNVGSPPVYPGVFE